ncbi:MAG: beta-Ala-His dipeptidase [Lachnospiraceae bacterium]|nr:beta-Ala-His dipeptidase [Lachnospiraceae bacterium]
MNVLNHEKPHQKYFEEISRIPRGSFNEAACADYLAAFAAEHGLKYIRDELNNVVIFKPAGAGYEDHGAVILQAHTDMVCEKNADCTHDFEKDPIDLYIENGILKARGTTLGADDGMGCAYMLAVLASDLPHPALECVFTVQEEVGLIGAFALKPEYFTAKRYVNLDFGGHGVGTCTTSAGGEMIGLRKPVEFDECDTPAYRIFVTGLKGGHSGGCIMMELGNSLKICGRILKEISGSCDMRIRKLDGGLKNNAIPRECEAVFASEAKEEDIRAAFESMKTQIASEIGFQEPDFAVTLERAESGPAICEEVSAEIVDLLYLLPTGLRHRSLQIANLPTASENLASVRTGADYLEFQYSLRAEKMSLRDQMEKEICILAGIYDMTMEVYSKFPSWEFNPNSALRETLCRVYKEQKDSEMELLATHGGLECGVFCDMIPGLDVVTLGAETDGAHTPKEQMNLESFDRTFDVLAAFLKEL